MNVAGGRFGTVSRRIGFLLIGFAGLLAAGFAILALALGEPAVLPTAIAGGVLLVIFFSLALLLLHRLSRPLDRLALDVRIIARENPGHRLGVAVNYPRWEPCPNGARSVLCGGRSVMSVPTAISEMSSQIIPLKGRIDLRDPAEFWRQRLFAFELRRRGNAARA